MKKTKFFYIFKILLVLVGLYITLIAVGAIYITPPWKVINPSQEGFDEQKFHLVDYASRKELDEVLKTLFPVGTPKDRVDKIMNSSGEVKIEIFPSRHPEHKGKILYQYGYYSNFRQLLPMFFFVPSPPPPAYRVKVEYDEDMRLKNIQVLWVIGFEWPFSFN